MDKRSTESTNMTGKCTVKFCVYQFLHHIFVFYCDVHESLQYLFTWFLFVRVSHCEMTEMKRYYSSHSA